MHCLWRRKERIGLELAAAEWKRWQPSRSGDGPRTLIELLGECDDALGLEALGDRLADVPVGQRLAIVGGWALRPRRQSPELDERRQQILQRALEDRSAKWGAMISTGAVTRHNPRVCDEAALALNERWPERYPFKWSSALRERDTAILALRNAIRASRGESPLPAPPERKPLSEGQSVNTLTSMRWLEGPPLAGLPLKADEVVTTERLAESLRLLHAALTGERLGFGLRAERSEDGGMDIEVTWRTGQPGKTTPHFSTSVQISAGAKSLLHMGGGLSFVRRCEATSTVEQAIEKALQAPAGEAVIIHYSTQRNAP